MKVKEVKSEVVLEKGLAGGCTCRRFDIGMYASRQAKKDMDGNLVLEPMEDEGLGIIRCSDCDTEYQASDFKKAINFSDYKKTFSKEKQDKIEERINEMMTYDRNEPNERTALIDELYSFWAIDELNENNELEAQNE